MRPTTTYTLAAVFGLGVVGPMMAGCEQDSALEEAGEDADEALEDAGEAAEDTVDDIEDELD
jgi:hypothetical protein